MPLYEYVCKQCSHAFEELSASDGATARAPCPKCAATDTERILFSRVAVGNGRADAAPAPCGRCGDPRGPGACSMS